MNIAMSITTAITFIYFIALCVPFAFADTNILSVSASSQYPTDSSSYYPGNAVDGNKMTAWFPNRTSKANKGEWIKFDFKKEETISSISIINGWIKSDRLFRFNSRIKTAFVEFSNGHKAEISLIDSKEIQNFNFGGIHAKWVKIIIDDIYPGAKWNHEAGITDVYFNNVTNDIDGSIVTSNTISNSNSESVDSAADVLGAAVAIGVTYGVVKWLFGGSDSGGSYATSGTSSYTPYENNRTSPTSSSNSNKSAYVTAIKKDGKYTIVECSKGKATKIYHDDYGKCSDNYNFGSYDCSSVIRWAKERCEKR